MDKLARKQQEQERIVRLANAMHEAGAHIAKGFQQLMEASGDESLHERVRMRARHIIEEGRLNYDQAVQELRRLEDEKRNDRLEAIAKSSAIATWVAVLVACASLLVSLVALKGS
jgi:CHASE3 domain sensor protein